jgi:isocitrate dehydrogenase kinase/phosphatase
MSLYHLVHGENEFAAVLLAVLGLTRNDVPRYRDCWWNGTHICLHTRTGGGNRPDYEHEHTALTTIDGYAYDEDDAFDSTYATFYFVPSHTATHILLTLMATDATPAQRWQAVLKRLRDGQSDAQTERLCQAVRPLFDRILKERD